MRGVYGEYFFGNKISEYGLKYNRVDYATLAKAFDAVRANGVMSWVDDWNLVCGDEEAYYEDSNIEIFQYYIISDGGAMILEEYTDEFIFYSDTLEIYVWGVTHFGTSWDYVLTDIPCKMGEKAFEE